MSTSVITWIVLIVFHISQDPSTANWDLIGEKCLRIYKLFNNYNGAKLACEQQNAALFSINNQKEKDFITNLQRHANMWVGLIKNSSSGKWIWDNGQELVNPQWWLTGNPGTKLVAHFRDGTLRGTDAALHHWYICEKKARYAPSFINTSQVISNLCGVEIIANCNGLLCEEVCQFRADCDQFAKMSNLCVIIKNITQIEDCIVKLKPNMELYRFSWLC